MNYKPIEIGIGLNKGKMILGTIGGEGRMDGTVISDAVNLASRVEGLTKLYGTPLLITNNFFSDLNNPGNYNLRLIDRVKVKGKEVLVKIFEVFDGDDENTIELKRKTKQLFVNGVILCKSKKYTEAENYFKQVLNINPKDKAAIIYFEKCSNESS